MSLRREWAVQDGQDGLTRVLAEVLRGEPDVILAFLFGSRAQGRARSASDFDIAVYLDASGEKDLINGLPRLQGRLEGSVKQEVDLVLLNTSAPALAAEALRGVPIVMKDERLYLELLCEKTQEAEDLRNWTFDLLRLRREYRREGRLHATPSRS